MNDSMSFPCMVVCVDDRILNYQTDQKYPFLTKGKVYYALDRKVGSLGIGNFLSIEKDDNGITGNHYEYRFAPLDKDKQDPIVDNITNQMVQPKMKFDYEAYNGFIKK